ncbi:hypothetical protein ACJX0J_042554, partial [Zea mays]
VLDVVSVKSVAVAGKKGPLKVGVSPSFLYSSKSSHSFRKVGRRKSKDGSCNGLQHYAALGRDYALDILGITKWRVNRRVHDVVETIWSQGESIAGLADKANEQRTLMKCRNGSTSIKKAKKTNRELHAERCDTELKLSVARKMRNKDGFYYPHNLDFRGRAYPMHPHLSHLGSDLCRGVLEYAEGRPLGKSGLCWLKIHLANKYGGGIEKLSHEGKLAFVENQLFDIFDSAANPVDGNCWWTNAEDPFQRLAACMDLSDALRSPSPYYVVSHLPIHQDGSCNGLQHYAALGSLCAVGGRFRNTKELQLLVLQQYVGAIVVNLVPGEKPADIYSEIASRYDKGGHLFLPSYIMRTHGVKDQKDAINSVPRKQLRKVFEVEALQGWWTRQMFLCVNDQNQRTLMKCRNGSTSKKKAKKTNHELHAERCDTELKLSVARKMREEDGFYYPHNLDFRGRAYPMHPHLNHLGQASFCGEPTFDIFDSAANPVDGNCWWTIAEDPFQRLAACMDLSDALRSPSPYYAVSHLLIHQDGSCNGLQHYAALGRDYVGVVDVNLVPREKPADIYSEIASRCSCQELSEGRV